MIKKTKIYKVIISAIALFSFIYWGLDPQFICNIASNTPQTCGYPERGLIVNIFGSGLSMVLCAMAVAILAMWISKD